VCVNVITSLPAGEAMYCDDCVCLPEHMSVVCLFASISLELHVRSSPNFLCMLPVAVARSCSGAFTIRYVLPVLWMTSYLHIMCHMQGCLCVTLEQPARRPDGAARRLGRGPRLKQQAHTL